MSEDTHYHSIRWNVIDCECMDKKLTKSGPLGTSGQA
jgi:hypothetical protein